MIAFFVLNAWILIPGSLCSIAARVYHPLYGGV